MKKSKSFLASLYEWVGIVTASLIVITLIFTFLFRFVNVDGTSMNSTLQDGDRLVLSCLPYTPTRGDIVVVSEGADHEPLIKRVIGLPGDRIRIDKETGEVYLNDEVLVEPYIHVPTAMEGMTGEITVPEGKVFIMGDNRTQGCSRDSRVMGCVPMSRLVGKAVFRLSPNFGGLYD